MWRVWVMSPQGYLILSRRRCCPPEYARIRTLNFSRTALLRTSWAATRVCPPIGYVGPDVTREDLHPKIKCTSVYSLCTFVHIPDVFRYIARRDLRIRTLDLCMSDPV